TQAERSVEVVGSSVIRRVIAVVRRRPGVRRGSEEIRESGQAMAVIDATARLGAVRGGLEDVGQSRQRACARFGFRPEYCEADRIENTDPDRRQARALLQTGLRCVEVQRAEKDRRLPDLREK